MNLNNCAGGEAGGSPEERRELRGAEEKAIDVVILTDEQSTVAAARTTPTCPGSSYTGIGIFSAAGGEVWHVGANTPASRAGIEPGDVVENIEILDPNRYSVGTPLQLRVARGGQVRTVTVFIGTVCVGQ